MVGVIKKCLLCIQSFSFHLRLTQVGWRRVKKGAMVIKEIARENKRETERERIIVFSLLSHLFFFLFLVLKDLSMLISKIIWCAGLSGLCVMMCLGCCLLSCYPGGILAHYSYIASVRTIITYARSLIRYLPQQAPTSISFL